MSVVRDSSVEPTATGTPPPAPSRGRGLAMRGIPVLVLLLVLAAVPLFVAPFTANTLSRILVFALFAVVALTLASVGLYGVVSHAVTERTHEIGVRMALGADRAHVLRLIVGQGLGTAVAGAVLGIAGALAIARAVQGLLFGVTATDPPTLAAVVATLMAVAIVACTLPAWRAARLDPTTALRAE